MKALSKFALTKDRIRLLLSGFNEVKGRETALTLNRLISTIEGYNLVTSQTKNRFESLIKGYYETLENLRKKQSQTAEEINILNVLGFTYDEVRHSRFLAYLFDRLETHAQRNLFFKIFLKEVNLPEDYAEIDYKVKPEVKGEESRIDIEIISKMRDEKGFIIHIENKVGDTPKREQIEREYRDLVKKANAMGMPESRKHGFLLSIKEPEKEIPFKWIGWDIIAKCLLTFIKEAKAERTRWIAEQYLECIKKNIIKGKTEIKEVEVKNEETE